MTSLRALAHALVLAVGVATLVVVGTSPARAAERSDATHTEHYFPAADGVTMLHADVLRPKGVKATARTPVILTVSPYTNHSGEALGGEFTAEAPSERFYDFLDLTDALDRGYTYVMVDLPGFGGSGGCNDWGGNREQGAVVAAVEWAASQSWSTGKVALLGKSYDAWTGLMGVANRPQGLAAVVAMEPVFAGYNYLYNNGVRFTNSLATPVSFQVNDALPGTIYDSPQYHLNGLPQAYCYPLNFGLQQSDSPTSDYWAERNLLPSSRGSRVPLFLTQGFLETNTKPDAAFDFWSGLRGAENRAWFGQIDHVRGWEKTPDGKRTQTGRPVSAFVDQVSDFIDLHLKGIGRSRPGVDVQDSLGRWRREAVWPPADTRRLASSLRKGVYRDTATNMATGPGSGDGVWTISQPLRTRAWLSGEPRLTAHVTTSVPRANLVGLVYDIDRAGRAQLISRGAHLLRTAGDQKVTLSLYGQDWVLRPGHRIGVLLTGADSSWWLHVPTSSSVQVDRADISLPFLSRDRTRFLPGGSSPRLEEHLTETATISAGIVKRSGRAFRLPRPLR
ncbi:MAG: CocE/NonD family hydrolase [Nocardioides sp.]